MRLVTFSAGSAPRAGVIASDETVIGIADLVSGAPTDMLGVIDAGKGLWKQLREASATAKGGQALASVKLLAPIPRPRRNIFCVGWNYLEHFEEGRDFRSKSAAPAPKEIPEFPTIFSKNPATVTGPDAPVWFPSPHSEQLDWEVELAVIVGQGGRDLAEEGAMEHVFGYTVANDVSVRDVQRRHGGQWFKGKNFDSHLPMGPWIVTSDELADPHSMRISTKVNGVYKQDSHTKYMVFKIPRLLREFSAGMALEAGDIIITGTPEGVGFARTPPEYLKVGDVMEVEVEKIGLVRNVVTRFGA